MKYIIEGGYIDKFICFSEEECKKYSKYFGIESERFVFCKLGVADSCPDGIGGGVERKIII